MQEVIPFVERNFAVDTTPAGRYIGGISMGGYSAVALALRHPASFSKVGGHSPALVTYSGWESAYRILYPDSNQRAQTDPWLLVDKVDLSGMTFWLDAGNQDGLIHSVSERFTGILQDHHARASFSDGPGGHDSAYWNEERKKTYLRFYNGT
jgi:enterochelin esterase-like enzyme